MRDLVAGGLAHIALLVDASGSMSPLRLQVLRSVDAYVATLREIPANVRGTLTVFNDRVRVIYQGVPMMMVSRLGSEYVPAGETALYDAIVETVEGLAQQVRAADRVIVAIMTDGRDTVSRTSQAATRDLVLAYSAKGWQFVFLGADPDVGRSLGITTCATLVRSTEGVRLALQAVADHAKRLLTAGNVQAGG